MSSLAAISSLWITMSIAEFIIRVSAKKLDKFLARNLMCCGEDPAWNDKVSAESKLGATSMDTLVGALEYASAVPWCILIVIFSALKTGTTELIPLPILAYNVGFNYVTEVVTDYLVYRHGPPRPVDQVWPRYMAHPFCVYPPLWGIPGVIMFGLVGWPNYRHGMLSDGTCVATGWKPLMEKLNWATAVRIRNDKEEIWDPAG